MKAKDLKIGMIIEYNYMPGMRFKITKLESEVFWDEALTRGHCFRLNEITHSSYEYADKKGFKVLFNTKRKAISWL